MICGAGFRFEFVSSVVRASSAWTRLFSPCSVTVAPLWHHWTHRYRAGCLPAAYCRGCSLSVLLLSTASRLHPGWMKPSVIHNYFTIQSWMWLLINSPSSLRSRGETLLCGSRPTSKRRNVCCFRGMPGRLCSLYLCDGINLMLRLPHNVPVKLWGNWWIMQNM